MSSAFDASNAAFSGSSHQGAYHELVFAGGEATWDHLI
jgi:hypothetical protein